MITNLPAAWPEKPGSASFPFFGVKPVIVDEKGNELEGATGTSRGRLGAVPGGARGHPVGNGSRGGLPCGATLLEPVLALRHPLPRGPASPNPAGECEGYLCFKQSWPSNIRTVHGDHAR